MTDETQIELTMRLWSTGALDAFEEYLDELIDLLPRHRGTMLRRVEPIDPQPGTADVSLVMAFPNALSIDSFLRDPARTDLDDLAGRAVARSVITDGRRRSTERHDGQLVPLRPNDG